MTIWLLLPALALGLLGAHFYRAAAWPLVGLCVVLVLLLTPAMMAIQHDIAMSLASMKRLPTALRKRAARAARHRA